MKRIILLAGLALALLGCQNPPTAPSGNGQPATVIDQTSNILTGMSRENLAGFKWMNDPVDFRFTDSTLQITPAEKSDFFNSPEDNTITATAPLLYQEVRGDFVATAVVKPDFASVWNAAALMVHIDSTNWIKFGFENSDATGKGIVSVVTKGTSDDSNGPILNDAESVWLRFIRKGDNYAMHWSKDGQAFKMARLSALPHADTVKIGMEAQCPAGRPATHAFLYFSLEQRTVKDLRSGE